jgi:hypothetical protein
MIQNWIANDIATIRNQSRVAWLRNSINGENAMPSLDGLPDRGMNYTLKRPLFDASLMSAAPVMLEALKKAERELSIYQAAMSDREIFSDTLRCIRLALAETGARA